jgi:MFS family permease
MLSRHKVLVFLFLLSMITYRDRICISVAGPQMMSDLNITPDKWGWVLGAFALSYAFFEIPSGALADRIGARKVLMRIVIWWSAFTSLTGVVVNFWQLLIVRFMFGAGEAGAYPGSSSAISRWFPATERARAQGIVWMASRIGGALTPVLVVPVIVYMGWRFSFYAFGSLGIIWAILWFWWYRDHPSLKPGVTAKELDDIGAGRTAPAHHGMPWGVALKNKNFWIILLMYHTYCWGGFFYLSWFHTYLQKGRGFTQAEMAIWSTLPFIGGACGNLFGGWLSDILVRRHGLRIGRRSIGFTGLFLSGLFLTLTGVTSGKLLAVIFLTLGYASMDCMLPVAWAVCLDVGRKYAGAMTGSMNMAGQVGSFVSSVAFGYMAKEWGSYDKALLPLAAGLFIAAFLFLVIDPTRQLIPEEQPAPQPADV